MHSSTRFGYGVPVRRAPWAIVLAALAVIGPIDSDSTRAADQFFAGDGSLLSAAKWGASAAGPFSNSFTSGNIANFATINGTGLGASITVGGINITENFTITTAGGTISNVGNGVISITVAAGMIGDFGSQNFSGAAGAGYIKEGDGVLALSGNTFQGGFTLNAGTVILRGVNAMGGGAANVLTINGGTIAANANRDLSGKYGGGIVIGGNFTLGDTIAPASANANLTFNNNMSLGAATRTINIGGTGTYAFGGIISGGTGAGLTFNTTTTSGRIDITNAANTFDGQLTFLGGEVRFSADGSFGAVPGSVTANAIVIDGGRMATAGGASFTLNSNRGIQVGDGAGSSISTPGSGTFTYDGVIADKPGETGSWAKQGGGTLALGGISTYSGTTAVNNGTLRLRVADNRLPAASVVSLGQSASNNVGIFDLNGFSQTVAGLVSVTGVANTATNTITSASAATLTVGGGGDYAYGNATAVNSGRITGAINLVMNGSGTQVLGDNNTYTGATSVLGGTLVISGTLANTSSVVVGGTGTLGGGGTINSSVTLQSGGSIAPGNASAGTLTMASLVLNGGALNFELGAIGAGTSDQIVLGTTPTISATTTFNFSSLIGFGNGTYTLLSGYSGTIANFGFLATSTSSLAGHTITLQNNFGELDLLVQSGASTGTNITWVGNVNANWNTTDANWTNGSPVAFGNGGNIVNFDNTTSTNNISVAAGGVTPESMVVNNDGSHNYVFTGGPITGTDGLVKLGSGTLTFSNSVSFAGGATVVGGTLQIGNGVASGSFAGDIVNNAAVAFNRTGSLTYTGVIRGSGSVSVDGGLTLILTGANTYTGGTFVVNGSLQIGNNGTSGSLAGNVAVDGQLIFNRSDAVTFNGNIDGNGGVTVTSGTVTLAGTNSYAGGFTLGSGAAVVTAADGAFGTGPMKINGGTLQSSGSRNFTAASLAVGGDFAFAGTGNARFNMDVDLGASTRAINNVTTGNGNSRQLLGVISGAAGAGLTFNGAGTALIYVGNTGNTFSGPVTVNAGEVVFNDDGAFGNATSITLDGGRMTMASMNASGVTSALTGASIGNGRTIFLGDTPGTSISIQGGSGVTTFNGVVADKPTKTGSLVKQGGGTLILGGVSTYSGTTAVNNGTIRLDQGDNRLPTGSVVSLGQASSGNLGTLDLNGFSQTIAGLVSTAGSNSGAGTNVVTSAGSATLTIGGSGSYVFGDGSAANSGVISGAINLVKTGSGVQTFGGANTYTGDTTVLGGMLVVNGSAASPNVAVASAGTLAGTGTLGGVVTSSGHIAPGASSVGTLTLGGLILTGGTLNFELGAIGAGTSDQLILTGSAAPIVNAATTFSLTNLAGFGAGTYSLISGYTGTVSNFGQLSTTTSLGGFTLSLQNHDGSIDLLVSAASTGTNIFWVGNVNANWDAAGNNWTNGAAVAFSNGGNIVNFGNTTSTNNITVAPGGVTPESMVVNNDGSHNYVFTGGAITGTLGLLKQGAGTLTFSNAVSFGGGATILGGTLQIGNGAGSGSFTGDIVNESAVAFNRTGSLTYTGVISGTGTVTVDGGLTLILAGANAYTGVTTVNSGTLQIGNNGTSGSLAGDVFINSGAHLALNRTDSTGFSNNIAGGGDVTVNSGTVTLAGNTFSGGFTLNAGTVIVSNNSFGTGTLTANGGTIISSGTRNFAPSAMTIGGNVEFGGSGNAVFAMNVDLGGVSRTLNNATTGGSRQFTGVISGGVGAGLTFIGGGSGKIYLGNTGNTFSGPIAINAGEVVFNDDGSFGASTSITLDGGRLTMAIMDTSGAAAALTAATISSTRNIFLGDGAGTSVGIQGTTGVTIYDGVIADKPSEIGSLVKQGGGTLALGGPSTYSGTTFVNNGALQLRVGNNRLPTATVVTLGTTASTNLGTLDLNGFNQTIAGLVSSAGTNISASTNVVTSATAATLTIDGSGSYVFGDGTIGNSGVISGSISLVKAGTGTQTLGGANAYSGNTTVLGGALLVNGSLASPTVAVATGGTLGGSGTLGGVVTSSGVLAPGTSGVGTLTVGGLVLNGGTLNFDLAAVLASDHIQLTGSAAPVVTATTNVVLNPLAGYGLGTYSLISGYGTNTIANFNLLSLGITTLSGLNVTLTNHAGTLDLVVSAVTSNSVAWTGAVDGNWNTTTANWTGDATVFTNSVSSVSFTDEATRFDVVVSGTGVVPQHVLVNNSVNTYTFSGGAINALGGLTKQGTGTLVLVNDNSYLSGVTIAQGVLQVGNGTTDSGSLTGDVRNSGVLVFNRTGTLAYTGAISGSGAVSISGGMTLVLTGANTYTGLTTIAGASTLRLDNGGSITGSVVNNGGSFSVNRSTSYAYNGVVSGTGGFTQAGTGATTLGGVNLYTGATAVNSGTLTVAGSLANSTVTVASGATLDGGGSLGGPVNVAGTLAGNLTVAGAVTSSGNLTPGGSLSIGTLTLASLVLNGGALNFDLNTTAASDKLVLTGGAAPTVNGLTTFNFSNFGGLTSGTYNLITWTGGTIANFSFTSSPTLGGYTLNLHNNAGAVTLEVVTTTQNVSWSGGNGLWNTTTTNFNGGSTTYSNGDSVSFGTTGMVNNIGIQPGGVQPGGTTISNDSASPYTFTGGAISGTGGLLKTGVGSLTFSNANTYTGGTTLQGGSLVIAPTGSIGNTGGVLITSGTLNVQSGGSITGTGQTNVAGGLLSVNGAVSGTVSVTGGGTLHGSGTVGAVVVNNGGIISAGNSVGSLTINGAGVTGGSSLTLNSGTDIVFEFTNATGTAGNVSGWDLIDLGTGVLNVNADNYSQSAMITLHVNSWEPGNTGPGAAANFDPLAGTPGNPTTGYFWKFIAVDDNSKIVPSSVPGSIGGRFLVIDDGVFAGNNPFTRPVTSLGQGTFRVLTGQELGMSPGLYLVYSAIPEPGTMVLTGLASLGAGWYGRRRLRKRPADSSTDSSGSQESIKIVGECI